MEGDARESRIDKFLASTYFGLAVVILVATIAFSLGRISGLQEKKEPVRVLNAAAAAVPTLNSKPAVNSEEVVASKNGTKYHYPWCAGAKQISSKNLITFNSIEEARGAGYSPASNCKGLK